VKASNPLHRARISRGISLARIATITCLSPRIVQQLDEGRFVELPGGVYARSYVRAFASAVGLDPEVMVAELVDSLPPAADPITLLRQNADRQTPEWIKTVGRGGRRLSAWCGITETAATPVPDRVPVPGPRRAWARPLADVVLMIAFYPLVAALAMLASGGSAADVMRSGWIGVTACWTLIALTYLALLSRLVTRTPRRLILRVPAGALSKPVRWPPTLHQH
jgi:hypothetical protein